jgi:hypothetical protein
MLTAFFLAAAIQAAAEPTPLDDYYLDLGTYWSVGSANRAIDSGIRIIGVQTGSIIKTDARFRHWAYIAGFDDEAQAQAACAKLIAKGRHCVARRIYPAASRPGT